MATTIVVIINYGILSHFSMVMWQKTLPADKVTHKYHNMNTGRETLPGVEIATLAWGCKKYITKLNMIEQLTEE